MEMNYNDWRESFENIPCWMCPKCQKGTLVLDKSSLKITEPAHSQNEHDEEAWEPDWIEERFSGSLVCSDKDCGEVSIITGNTSHWNCTPHFTFDDDWKRFFVPHFINPAPNIFSIPNECPEEIRNNLQRAFSLFWPDKAACANSLRTTVEIFLSNQDIQRLHKNNKGEEKPIPLHSRISIYKEKAPETAKLLEAIKWLGNVGSHDNPYKPKLDDLLTGFKMFEHVVECTYVKGEKKLQDKAKALIKGKGRSVEVVV